MRTTILLLSLALLNECAAVTVRFDDLDRAPAESFVVGSVTINADGQLPATVAGVGLGISGLGSDGEVNLELHYEVGKEYPSFAEYENRIGLQSDGRINSITIQPQLKIFDGSDRLTPDQVAFDISVTENIAPEEELISRFRIGTPTSLSPIILRLQPGDLVPGRSFWINVTSYESPDSPFIAYRQAHLDEDQIFRYGFSILALDYTPVPEPSTLVLLSGGLLALWFGRKFSTRKP